MPYYIEDVQKAIGVIRDIVETDWKFSEFTGIDIRLDTHPRFDLTVKFRSHRRYNGYDGAWFSLVEQVNCCGVLVSTRTGVHVDFQKMGLAQAMMPIKEAIARKFGYSTLAATVNMTGNPAEVHILEKHSWTKGWEFKNKRTNNQVGFFFKKVE